MAIAARQLVRGGRRERELAEVLRARPDLVGQRCPHLVEPIPFRFARVTRRHVEEHVVLDDRAADPCGGHHLGRQQRVAKHSRLDADTHEIVRQLIVGHQVLRHPVHATKAGESIRATSADRVDDGSSGPAELRADAASLHVDFRDVELVDLRAEIAERRAGDVGAVDEIQIVLPASACCRADRAPIVGNAGDQLEQASVGALEREAVEGVVLEVEANLGRSNVHDRAGGADRHRFLER